MSVHQKLNRVRKPRVHITYDVETGDATTGKLTHLGTDLAGNAYITGFTRDNIDWNNDWQTTVTARGLIVLSYDPQGELRWAKAASGALDGQSVAVFSAEALYVAGTAFGFVQMDDFLITAPSFYFPFLAKIKTTPTEIAEKYQPNHILISPNPVIADAIISLRNSNDKIAQMEIYHANGQNVFLREDINETETTINGSKFRSGFYLIKIITNQGKLIVDKMIVK